MTPSNYHTHTSFCDGDATPEELVREAIRLGCPEIGFSGHCHTFFDESYCMSKEGTEDYIAAVKAVKEAYKDQIKVYLGIEMDYYGDVTDDRYDYRIGSVHYVKKDGCYLPVDNTKKEQINDVEKFYGGDFYSFAEDYFATVADVHRKTRCQILGHFDLVTKFNQDGDLFDTQHPRYRAAADKALEALMDTPVILEVNMGAMARGYTTQPYPAPDVVRKWLSAGKPVIYSSDCHRLSQLLYQYDHYEAYIQACTK